MCFHSKQSKNAQTVAHKFDAVIEDIDEFLPSNHYNGFKFPKTPIVTNKDFHKIAMVNWGLVPFWADKNWNKAFTLNARIETIHQKKSFKEINQNRCIIIVDGFYEWQLIGKQKVKYEIGFDNQLFALAGLYDENKGYKSYTIITTKAQGIMKEIHNTKQRMPIALNSKLQTEKWLNGYDVVPDFDFSATLKSDIQTRLF